MVLYYVCLDYDNENSDYDVSLWIIIKRIETGSDFDKSAEESQPFLALSEISN